MEKDTSMQNETFTYYIDPGHGWLRVPKKYLIAFGLVNKVSSYSYVKGDDVYLEEDCDMTLFCDAFVNKFGQPPNIKSVYEKGDSPIRNYPYYRR